LIQTFVFKLKKIRIFKIILNKIGSLWLKKRKMTKKNRTEFKKI